MRLPDEGSGDGWSDDGGPAVTPSQPELPGERYRIESLLGRGGMGEVFLAWDEHLTRHVALKRLHAHTAHSPDRLARMVREAQVAARLDHPGIVPVLDLGTTLDGAIYYTMRLIQGRTLTEARGDLSTTQLLRHLAAAVQAVAFAHARGIVHRDLKPDNVMVGAYGETQVVDWGLARPVHGPELPNEDAGGEDLGLTRLGAVVGTQRYLSPEAAQGLPMGPADDVYALGATLVELLTGETATAQVPWSRIAERIADRELVTIANQALAEPAARYPDAGALSEALQAYLEGRPVGGHVYSVRELGRRLAERWRWPLRVGGAAALAAIAGLTLAGIGVLRERDRAVAAEQRERGARIAADRTLAASLAHQAVLALREGARPEAGLLAAEALALAPLPRARGVLMALGRGPEPTLVQLDTPCPGQLSLGPDGVVCVDDGRVWDETGELFRGEHEAAKRGTTGTWITTEKQTLHVPGGRTWAGRGLLYADGERAARLLRVGVDLVDSEGRELRTEPCGDVRSHRDGAWAPEGFWLVCLNGTAVRVSLDGPELRVPLPGVAEEIHSVAYTGGKLLVATGGARIDIRDLHTGERIELLETQVPQVRRLHTSPDGRWLLIEGDREGPTLWSLEHGRSRIRLPRRWRGAVFQRDGRLVTVRQGSTALDPDSVVDPTSYSPAGLSMATLDPAGDHIAGAAGDGSVRIWNARTGDLELDRLAHDGFVIKWVAYTPDSTELIVASPGISPPLRLSVPSLAPLAGLPESRFCRRVVTLTDSIWCVSWTRELPKRLDRPTPSVPSPSQFHDSGQNGPEVAVAIDQDGRVVVLRAGAEPRPLAQIPRAGRVDVTADGAVVAVAGPEGIVLLDADGAELGRIPVDHDPQDVALSPDGTWVAAAFLDGSAAIWRVRDRALQAELDGVHTERIASLQFGSDLLISAGWDGRVHRWSLEPLTVDPDPAAIAARWSLDLDRIVED